MNILSRLQIGSDIDVSYGAVSNSSARHIDTSGMLEVNAQIETKKPEARSPKPEARSPKPEARSPKPEARSPKPEARSPKPDARSPKPGAD